MSGSAKGAVADVAKDLAISGAGLTGRIESWGPEHDNYRWLFVQRNPLRVYVGSNNHAHMLVPRLPISRSG